MSTSNEVTVICQGSKEQDWFNNNLAWVGLTPAVEALHKGDVTL